MLSFFRSGLKSKLALGLLFLVLLAIAVSGIGTPSNLGSLVSGGGSNLATVGSTGIAPDEILSRLQNELKQRKQEAPGLDMAAFVRGGAVEGMLGEVVDYTALRLFGEKYGVRISKRLIDGEISSIEAFRGASGKFDETRFRSLLADRGMTETRFRTDLAMTMAAKHLLVPASEAAGVPRTLVVPYAALMLERRSGLVAAVPARAMATGTAPANAELDAYYKRNAARYTVPELRSVRYAVFDQSRFVGKVAPTDTDITAYYNKNAAKYAARESRGLTQIIVQDQASANAIAAKIGAGASMAEAAKGVGLEALTIKPVEQKAFANQSSEAVAASVFAAAKGSVAKPVKSGLGWHVVHVDSVAAVAATPIAVARPEIIKALAQSKVDEALADFVAKIEEDVTDGQSFDDVVTANGLTVVTSPELTASGIAPNDRGYRPDPRLASVIRDAFQADPDDDAAVASLTPQSYAFYDLGKVTPSSPRPLASIKAQVLNEFLDERMAKAARKIAEEIARKANLGTSLSTAVAASGVRLPAPSPIAAKRLEIAQAKGEIPAPIKLMFSMSAKKAKVIEIPGNQGWFVVWVDKIEASGENIDPRLLAATQQELGGMISKEYADQFTAAVRNDVTVKRNAQAITTLKNSLTGAGRQ
jgi:peptidyl-prolyl cis-trans isomerase D